MHIERYCGIVRQFEWLRLLVVRPRQLEQRIVENARVERWVLRCRVCFRRLEE